MTSITLLLGWAIVVATPAAAHEPFATKVQLTLSTTTDVCFERAPVSFEVQVENLTDNHLDLGLVMEPVYRKFVQVLYRRLPHEFQPLIYTSEWDLPAPAHPRFTQITLDRGQREGFHLSLAADPGRSAFIFDQPGDYELKVVYDVSREIRTYPRDLLETSPARIHVEAAPPSEAAALEDWDVELAIFAQDDGAEGGPRFRQALQRAIPFLDAHPDSLYARALRPRVLDTLGLLARQGSLTSTEREAYERLKPKPTGQR